MDFLAVVLFIVSGALVFIQLIMTAAFTAAVRAGRDGRVSFWPIIIATALSIYAVSRLL